MRIMGLDPSLTGTGCVVVEDGTPYIYEYTTKPGDGHAIDRAGSIAGDMMVAVRQHQPQIAYIEGYAHASNNLVPSVTVGTVLRYFLRQNEIPFVEISPNSLKKFATGVGNGKKEQMILAAYKRWGVEFQTNNMCDAYCLAMFGLACHGELQMPRANMDACHKFMAT